MASARFHRPEENNQSEPSWSLPSLSSCQSLVNSDQTVKLGSADQIRINTSVTVMPISQKHFVVYCLAVNEKVCPCSDLVLTCLLSDRITTGLLKVCLFTPGIRMRLHMRLQWPLVIRSLRMHVNTRCEQGLISDPAAMLRSAEGIPSTADQPQQTFSFFFS